MKYLPLIFAGLWRRPTRTIFTFLSIVVAFILFGVLTVNNLLTAITVLVGSIMGLGALFGALNTMYSAGQHPLGRDRDPARHRLGRLQRQCSHFRGQRDTFGRDTRVDREWRAVCRFAGFRGRIFSGAARRAPSGG